MNATLSLCVIKRHAIKIFWGVGERLHATWPRHLTKKSRYASCPVASRQLRYSCYPSDRRQSWLRRGQRASKKIQHDRERCDYHDNFPLKFQRALFYFSLRTLLSCIPPLWSSRQSSWLYIQRFRVRFPVLLDFLSSGSGTGSTQPREDNWGATWKESSGFSLEKQN
jgi:hypothetical protein